MATTVMSVKTNKQLKEKAQEIARDMGFPLGTLVNAFLRQFVRNRAVFFSTEPSEMMTKSLEKKLAKIEKDIARELHLSPKFGNIKDAIAYLAPES